MMPTELALPNDTTQRHNKVSKQMKTNSNKSNDMCGYSTANPCAQNSSSDASSEDSVSSPSNGKTSHLSDGSKNNRKAPIEPLNDIKTARAICRAVNGTGTPRVPAIEYLKGILAEHSGSEGHLDSKKRAVRYLKSVLMNAKRSDAEMWDVTSDDIGQVVAHLVRTGRSGVTIRLYLNVLGALFEIAVKRKVLRKNVVRKIKLPPRPKNSPRRPFTDEELQKVCDIADDEWFGMMMFGLYTGLRLGDVSRLVYRDLDLTTKFIRANVKKTKKFEAKPIAPPLALFCSRLKVPADLDQPLFPRAYALVMADQSATVSNQFVKLLVKAGVRARGVKVRDRDREGAEKYLPLSFHCLRHNHTTMLKRGKIPEAIARRIAGHLSIAMSDVYTSLGEDITLAAVDDLPEILDLSLLFAKAA